MRRTFVLIVVALAAQSVVHLRSVAVICVAVMKVEITALAETDLETIYLHIREDSPPAPPRGGRACCRPRRRSSSSRSAVPSPPRAVRPLRFGDCSDGRYRVLFSSAHDTV